MQICRATSDIGPVNDLKLKEDGIDVQSWTATLEGTVVLDDRLPPFGVEATLNFKNGTVRVAPGELDDAAILSALFGLSGADKFLEVLQSGTAPLRIERRAEPRPFALAVSGRLPLPPFPGVERLCQLDFSALVTIRGIQAPEELVARCDLVIPVLGTGTAIVNPGIAFYPARPSMLALMGDLTADLGTESEAAARALKFDGKLEIDMRQQTGSFRGDAILADSLKMFEMQAEMDLRQLSFSYSTIGGGDLENFIRLEQSGEFNGTDPKVLSTLSSISLLGLASASISTDFRFAVPDLAIVGHVNVPLATAVWFEIFLTPDLKRMNAEASFKFGVSRWDGLKGKFFISPASAKLEFAVMDLPITIELPSAEQITPSYVRSVILSLLEVRPEDILKWLRNPEITVAPVNGSNSGNVAPRTPDQAPIGEGDPVNGEDREGKPGKQNDQADLREEEVQRQEDEDENDQKVEDADEDDEKDEGEQVPVTSGYQNVAVGRDGAPIYVRLTDEQWALREQTQFLKRVWLAPANMPDWWQQDCRGDHPRGHYELRYFPNDGQLTMLRMDDCQAEVGYLTFPNEYNLDFFLFDAEPRIDWASLDQMAEPERTDALSPAANAVLTWFTARYPRMLDAETETKPSPAQLAHRILQFPNDTHAAFVAIKNSATRHDPILVFIADGAERRINPSVALAAMLHGKIESKGADLAEFVLCAAIRINELSNCHAPIEINEALKSGLAKPQDYNGVYLADNQYANSVLNALKASAEYNNIRPQLSRRCHSNFSNEALYRMRQLIERGLLMTGVECYDYFSGMDHSEPFAWPFRLVWAVLGERFFAGNDV